MPKDITGREKLIFISSSIFNLRLNIEDWG